MPRPAPLSAVACDVAVPPGVLAAIAGGALRAALPFGDPVPQARGVLVEPHRDGHWTLAFARDGIGWRPLGSHRVALQRRGDAARAPTIDLVAQPIDARRETAPVAFALTIAPTGNGARLSGDLAAELLPALEHALALAGDPATAAPGLAEPNLAAWCEHRLLAEDPAGSALHLLARRLGCAAALQVQWCQDAERRGEDCVAADHAWLAALTSRDARERAAMGEQLQALHQRHGDALAWRAAAREQLRNAEIPRANAFLHTARRLHDEPAMDYRLQSLLHTLRDDTEAARANALLAREHAGVTVDLPTFAAELWLHAAGPSPALAHAAPPR